MSEVWPITTLGELGYFISGVGFPEHLQGRDSGDLPFYKVSDMSLPGNEIYLGKANNYVSAALARRRGWKPIPAEAIVFAKVGAALLLNRRRKLSTESLVDNNMIAVYPIDQVSANWLYWQLLRVDFADFVQDGALPSVNQSQLSEIRIPTPDGGEQEKITGILDTLDTAIRETEAIIAKLKAIKQGLLHDLLTRGIGADGELRPPQSEAPQLYKDSPLGWIPKEWEVSGLSTVAPVFRSVIKTGPFGSSLKGEHWRESGRPVVTIGSLGDGRFIESELLFIGESTAKRLSEFELIPGDIVFSRVADVGRSVVITDAQRGWIMSSNFMRISIEEKKARPLFLQMLLASSVWVRRQIRVTVNSGGRDIANSEVLMGLSFPWPDPTEQDAILDRVESLSVRIDTENTALVKLLAAKSGLMDDLLTGRVRVTPLLAAESP